MALIDFIYRTNKSRTTIGMLRLDLLVSEELDLANGATRYPVEDGSEISDHIKEGTVTVRISGEIAASEGWLARDTKLSMIDALEALEAMHKARETITIVTGLTRYADLAIERLNAVRANSGEGGGNWMKITGEFVRIRKVESKTAEVQERQTQGSTRGRAGTTRPNTQNSTNTSQSGTAAANPGDNGSLSIRAADRALGRPVQSAADLGQAAQNAGSAAWNGLVGTVK